MGIHWIIFVTFVILSLQSFIYNRWGLRGVDYIRYFNTGAAFEGDQVELVEEITNRKLLPLPWLRLESTIHAGLVFSSEQNLDISGGKIYQNHKSMFSLLPYMHIKRRHQVTCARRGYYQLTNAAITCGDLVGFGSSSKDAEFYTELIVYPKSIAIEDVPLPSHSWQGDILVRRWIVEDPFMIAGVREYGAGDPQHAINWKSTAKVGRLQVHKRDFTSDHRLLLLVNFENTEKMWGAVQDPESIEQGLSYAAAIAGYTLSHGIETGFGCNGIIMNEPKKPVHIEPKNTREQQTIILETMAKLLIERSLPFDAFLEEQVNMNTQNSDILLITAFVSAKMEQQIERLRQLGNAVEIVWLKPSAQSAKEEAV